MVPSPDATTPCVGIVVLNYHHATETLDCVRSLFAKEPATTRVLWVENDSASTGEATLTLLRDSGLPFQVIDEASAELPPTGTLGVLFNAENLGYAGGNNRRAAPTRSPQYALCLGA